jgi:hypothetical protein
MVSAINNEVVAKECGQCASVLVRAAVCGCLWARHPQLDSEAVLHRSGGAAAFRSRSVAACGFRIRTSDGLAFLHSMQCATALISHLVSPKGPDVSQRAADMLFDRLACWLNRCHVQALLSCTCTLSNQ